MSFSEIMLFMQLVFANVILMSIGFILVDIRKMLGKRKD